MSSIRRSDSLSRPADEESPLLTNNGNGILSPKPNDNSDDEEVNSPTLAEEPSNRRLFIVLGTCYLGVFLGALDSTIIATLSAPISTTFNSLSLLSWLATAYLIANAACQPISGRLTDIFSRRYGLVLSNILFGAGNLMCGLAQNEWMMIAGRVVAGMGGGGLMAISTFVASDLVPLRKRGIIQGIGNLCFGTGAGLGGLFGGWINDIWGWRLAFLIQVPFVALSGVAVWFVVDIPLEKSDERTLSRIDFVGAGSLVIFLLLLLLGLNSGGNIVPWTHPLVIVSLLLSALALALFVYWEDKHAKEPVIPVRLLLHRTVAAACLTNWLATAGFYIILFYTPIFFQIMGLSTTQAGLRLIPHAIGLSCGSLGSGLYMKRTGNYKNVGLFLLALQVVGTACVTTLSFQKPTWPAYVYLYLIGLGYGGMLTVTLLACISAVEHKHQAVITSATYAFRSTGSTIGVTIASAVYQNVLRMELWRRFEGWDGAERIIERLLDGFGEIERLPSAWRFGVEKAYGSALGWTFWTACACVVVAWCSAVFMKQHVLHSTLARK